MNTRYEKVLKLLAREVHKSAHELVYITEGVYSVEVPYEYGSLYTITLDFATYHLYMTFTLPFKVKWVSETSTGGVRYHQINDGGEYCKLCLTYTNAREWAEVTSTITEINKLLPKKN